METLVSGLDEVASRAALGIESLERHSLQWCRPSDLASKASGHAIVWLYHAPWSMWAGTDAPDTSRELLARWLETNRSMLNTRGELAGKLILVNVDRISPDTLLARVTGSPAEHAKPADLPASPQSQALATLFALAAPEYWEVFEALEAASWLPAGEPLFRALDAPAIGTLYAVMDALRGGEIAKRTVVELQKRVETGTAADHKLRQENDELRQEGELLLLQLHQVQEELEQYYLKTVEQDKSVTRLTQSLTETQTSNKALQSQLRQMQDELKRLQKANLELTQPKQDAAPAVPASAPAATLAPRANHHSRASGRWMPAVASNLLARTRRRKLQQVQFAAIRKSEWFDGQWYLDTYPDVRGASVDPIRHYLESGWRENRNPCPYFDTAFYLQSNPDICEAGINPLWHFIEFGQKEGRRPRKA